VKKILISVSLSAAMAGCKSTPSKPIVLYKEPVASESIAKFVGEDSEAVIFGKGHEKIHICKVNGESIPLTDVNRIINVEAGQHTLNVCYREGGNSAEASFTAAVEAGSKYKVKLGEHSWTKVNFSIIDQKTDSNLVELVTVPKIAGDITILVFQ
jgi:hypothetical protein